MRLSSVPLFLVYGNSALAMALVLGLILGQAGVTWLSLPLSLIGLIGPAFCLVMAIEQMSEGDSSLARFFFTLALLYLIITPLGTYLVHVVAFDPVPVTHIVQSFFVWWALCFFIAECVVGIKRQPTILHTLSLDRQTKRELVWISGIFSLVMIANLMIYPLLPEGDGYFYLMKIQERIANPQLFAEETRQGFFVLIHLMSRVSNSDPYWIFKVVLPFAHGIVVLAAYTLIRPHVTESRYRILFSLAPLYFPVVLQEAFISRPQSIFLIAFIPFLSVMADVVTNGHKVRAMYWLIALFLISGAGIKIHTLFGLLPVAIAIALIVYLRHEIAKRPLDAVAIILGLAAVAYPGVIHSRLVPDLQQLAKLFVMAMRNGPFEWWFIDHYRNVDGIEVGWPGISSVFYYGYNMGVFLVPVLFFSLATVVRGRSFPRFRPQGAAITFLVAFFLFIAEIAPRFSLAYLPDRAWLFLALLLAIVVPPLAYPSLKQWGKIGFGLVAIAAITSVAAGSAITYAKQGWVTSNEVKAARYIRDNLPGDAIIIGPSSMQIMVRYYADRPYDHGRPDLFLHPEQYQLDDYLRENEEAYRHILQTVRTNRLNLQFYLREVAEAVARSDVSNAQITQYLDSTAVIVSGTDAYIAPQLKTLDIFMPGDQPIYFVYDRDKFSSLYGQRAWWRTSNFYGADIATLGKIYPVIYDQNGIMIWEVRK